MFVRLAEKVAVTGCPSESFHSRDNKMIRQISVCEGRRGWFEFCLGAKQESEHGEQSQKPAWLRQGRHCQVWFPPHSCNNVLIHVVPLSYTPRLLAYKRQSYLRTEVVKVYPEGTQSQVLCSMDGCGIEFYGGGAKLFVGWAARPR